MYFIVKLFDQTSEPEVLQLTLRGGKLYRFNRIIKQNSEKNRQMKRSDCNRLHEMKIAPTFIKHKYTVWDANAES